MQRNHPGWRTPLDSIRLSIAAAVSTMKLRPAAFSVINALQQFNPSLQVDAAFMAAVAMAQGIGLDPHEMVARAKRILLDAESGHNPTDHVGAIRDYAREELKR